MKAQTDEHAAAGASPWTARSAGIAWILLDWAASGFSTISITLLMAYVEQVAFRNGGWGVSGGVVWAWAIAAAMLLVAVIAPLAATWADRKRAHTTALLVGVAIGSGALIAMAAVPPAAQLAVAACVVAAHVGFDMAVIFTGSLLPRIATGPAADRLSAAGFAAGYASGAIVLIVASGIVGLHDRLGLSTVGGLQAAFVFTGCWWLLFSLPAAAVRYRAEDGGDHAGSSVGELIAYLRELVRPVAAGHHDGGPGRLLLGSVLAMGAVQTAIAQFSSVALQDFHLEGPALVRLVLLVQVVALPGAILVGWLSFRWSRRGALTVCLAGWVAVLVLAWFVRSTAQLHALAVLLALVLGGIQSVIRAMIATIAAPGRAGATFGLVQVGTKLAGFAASLLFGLALAFTGVPRAGLLVLLGQLLFGWWLLAADRSAGGVPGRPAYASPSTSRIE